MIGGLQNLVIPVTSGSSSPTEHETPVGQTDRQRCNCPMFNHLGLEMFLSDVESGVSSTGVFGVAALLAPHPACNHRW